LPQRDPRHFARRERQQGKPLDLTLDGTERRRQRPKHKEKQAWHYSGKKKVHTDNVVIVNTQSKRVGILSDAGQDVTALVERISHGRPDECDEEGLRFAGTALAEIVGPVCRCPRPA